MPVHVGIACEKCGKIYFPANTARIEANPYRVNPGLYRLTCAPPCNAVRLFRKYEMQPYSVSTYSYESGFANRGEYEELRRAG